VAVLNVAATVREVSSVAELTAAPKSAELYTRYIFNPFSPTLLWQKMSLPKHSVLYSLFHNYFSDNEPHLDYASTVWCPYKIGDIEVIEKVQNKATKLVIQLKKLPYTERLKELDLHTL